MIKKPAFYLVAIFVIGLATGIVVGVTLAKRQMMETAKFSTISRLVKKELTDKLDLDTAQQQKINPLVDRNVDRIQGIYYDTLKRIDGVLRDGQDELVADLRPDQVRKLSTLAKSREDFIRKHNPLEARK